MTRPLSVPFPRPHRWLGFVCALTFALFAMPHGARADDGIPAEDTEFFNQAEVDTNSNCIPERCEQSRTAEFVRRKGPGADTLRVWLTTCESVHGVPGGWIVYLATCGEMRFPATVRSIEVHGRRVRVRTYPTGCAGTVAFRVSPRLHPYARHEVAEPIVIILDGGWRAQTTLQH